MTLLALHSAPRAPGALKFLSVGRTHVGRVRTLNEDAYLDCPRLGVWAVSDGMGGHEGGNIASNAIVDALAKIGPSPSAYALRDAVSRALRQVNADLHARYAGKGHMAGATVVVLIAFDGHYACLWAGDSRAYLYRGGRLRQLTRDHTVVQDLVASRVLTPAQARAHPQAHVITRAVGAHETLNLESAFGPIRPGDRFLLSSDGLHGGVDDRDIAAIIHRPPLEAAAEKLVEKALAACGRDNITALLIGAEQ